MVSPGDTPLVTGLGPYALLTLVALMGAADRVERRGRGKDFGAATCQREP
jgi:hypothetical protein